MTVLRRDAPSEGTSIVCRDLRIRNFGGPFGTLTVRVDRYDAVAWSRFDV